MNESKLARVTATRFSGMWVATVLGDGVVGYGQAAEWTDAINAAIEDLREKEEKKS